jgi:RimJ/RimL family protein N-acetyltransferase
MTDAPLLQKWSNDPELRALIGEVMPSSRKDIDMYIEKTTSSTDRVWFMIEVKETGQVIGEAGLLRMFPPWRTTDLSIILGEESSRGQGYGTEAIRLLLDYAFGALNFHRVSIGVVGFNKNALKFYEKIGFKREGVQRDGYFFNYHFSDFVMLSILENEYYGTKPLQ